MSSLKEKERKKEQQDKFQAILSALLKDEDNKYCVDCDAKGPRWASWNLGIFMCIRCAGIHRNLGVHITRVKSVNLDTWTPEQVAMVQEIGNSRARAAYEANLPDGYRRPQTDSALEAFIRSKYEHKKYMAREWVPPQPKVPKEWLEDKTEKKKPKPKQPSAVKLTNVPKSEPAKPQPAPVKKTEVTLPQSTDAKVNSLTNDLLGLDLTPPQTNVVQTNGQQPPSAAATSGSKDLLELFGGAQPTNTTANTATPAPNQTTNQNAAVNGSSSDGNLFGDDFKEEKKSLSDSIMALYGGSTGQPQMYGVPGGMYIPQNQQAYPNMMGQNQGVMGQNQAMMGQQQAGMMGQQLGMMGQQQNMMGQQPQGMMGQTNMMGQQAQGMMGQQQRPGVVGQQQNMMGQQPNMMGQQPNMMGQQQNMMGQQQNSMGQQQPGMMGMMGQQPQGMMGNNMMNGSQQSGMFGGQGQMMMGNTGMYNPQQMQQFQYQQQQPMAKTSSGWGNPTGQTLSNNLWQ